MNYFPTRIIERLSGIWWMMLKEYFKDKKSVIKHDCALDSNDHTIHHTIIFEGGLFGFMDLKYDLTSE